MKKPQYLRQVAHIFGDPLLEATGLEGGHLADALQLMQQVINEVLLPKFPAQRERLQILHRKIQRCLAYLLLIKEDRHQNTQQASQAILNDIQQLNATDWLLLPGGWQGRTKPGHAMLYLIQPSQFTVINTGAGIDYHAQQPQPHANLAHFFSVNFTQRQALMDSAVIPSLLRLLIQPADYYEAGLIYQVILPQLATSAETRFTPQHAYSTQLAGTCFWQCVDKLLFWQLRDQPQVYTQMQLALEHWQLDKIWQEFGTQLKTPLTPSEFTKAPWETYLRLIGFGIRQFSAKVMQYALTHQEQHQLTLRLVQLQALVQQNLDKHSYLATTTTPTPIATVNIDSQFSVFDESSHKKPDCYFAPPPQRFDQGNLLTSLMHLNQYLNALNWQQTDEQLNALHALECCLNQLPIPYTQAWSAFWQKPFSPTETEQLAQLCQGLSLHYYHLQTRLHHQPSPVQYAKRIIHALSLVCLLDFAIKHTPGLGFMQDYALCLTRLADGKTLSQLAPTLVVTSPQAAQRLQAILRYLASLHGKRVVFGFQHHQAALSIAFREQITIPDVQLLEDCRQQLGSRSPLAHVLQHERLDLRLATQVLDSHKQAYPKVIHYWRELGIYARLLLSSLAMPEVKLPAPVYTLQLARYTNDLCTELRLQLYAPLQEQCFENYGTKLVKDPAIRWLCDAPQAEFVENRCLVNRMPEPTLLNRWLFNQLAEIRVSPNLQLMTLLDLIKQQIHQLQQPELRYLLEKFLFHVGPDALEQGSLCLAESQQNPQLQPWLLEFLNKAEYYFAGQLSKLETYLSLIRCFLAVERFLINSNTSLICQAIYDKLSALANAYPSYQAELAAHQVLLYQNYMLSAQTHPTQVVERVLGSWATVIKARLMGELTAERYAEVKPVVLNLAGNLTQLLRDSATRQRLLTQFLAQISGENLAIAQAATELSLGCYQVGDYLLNLLDGKIFYKGYPVRSLPDEVMQASDYRALYGKKVLAIELDRGTQGIQIFRALAATKRYWSLYQYTQPLAETFIGELVATGQFSIFQPEQASTGFAATLKAQLTLLLEKLELQVERLLLHSVQHYLLVKTATAYVKIDLNQAYALRQYGQRCYWQLIFCSQLHGSYFTPATLKPEISQPYTRYALQAEPVNSTYDLLIHEQISYQDKLYWAQYLPTWRLAGLLPQALLTDHTYWLICETGPDNDFMLSEQATAITLNTTGATQYILARNAQQQWALLIYLLPNGQLQLVDLKTQAQWLDMLRLAATHPLAKPCQILAQFELPTYLLAWQHSGITLHLPRHRLSFRYEGIKQRLMSLQFNDYALQTELKLKALPHFGYALVLKNPQDEILMLLPHTPLSTVNCADDALHSHSYSDLQTLLEPSYFAYHYHAELERLQALSLEGEQYLVLLYLRSKDYRRAYEQLEACWTDQLLNTNQWQLFERLFAETQADQHPDNHACRLAYFSLYLPIFLALAERKELSAEEQTQLNAYQALSQQLATDYQKYLAKWHMVTAKLRLSRRAEQQLLTVYRQWHKTVLTWQQNRWAYLQDGIEANLTLAYPSRQAFDQLLTAVMPLGQLKQLLMQQQTLLMNNTAVDHFGHVGDKAQPLSACFGTLYQAYLTKQRSKAELLITLRAMAWANPTVFNSEQGLALLLRYVLVATNLPALPNLQDASRWFSLSNQAFNTTNTSKTLATWLRCLLEVLEAQALPPIMSRNLTVFLAYQSSNHRYLALTPSSYPAEAILPRTTPPDAIPFSAASFQRRYGFDPQQPLGQFFKRFFCIQPQHIAKFSSPLVQSLEEKRPYDQLFTQHEMARQLKNQFDTDFALFLRQPQDQMRPLQTNAGLFNNLCQALTEFLIRLQVHAQQLLTQLLQLATRNPHPLMAVSSLTEPMINGLQQRLALLADHYEPLDLTQLLKLFIHYTPADYSTANGFLTPNDIAALGEQTLSYLLLISASKHTKRVLNLLQDLIQQEARLTPNERQGLIEQIGRECYQQRYYSLSHKPHYLYLEYRTGFLLWQSQITTLERLQKPFAEQIEQLIMGGGKSSMLAPLLGHSLADGKRLLVYTVPAALKPIFTSLLRHRFSGPWHKRVHTLDIQRRTVLTARLIDQLYQKLHSLIRQREVLVVTPEVPNCLQLKWLELAQTTYQGDLSVKETLLKLEDVLSLLNQQATQLIDELDLVLDPLKSELNFTQGKPELLQPAPLRWQYAQELILLLLQHSSLKAILSQGAQSGDCKLYPLNSELAMLELNSEEFYHHQLKPVLVSILLREHFNNCTFVQQYQAAIACYLLADPGLHLDGVVYLAQDLMTALTSSQSFAPQLRNRRANLRQLLENEPVMFRGEQRFYVIANTKLYITTLHPLIADIATVHIHQLKTQDAAAVERLILAKEWLSALFPHVLQKRLNIYYGPYFETQLVQDKPQKVRFAHKKLAVPYLGKDAPNKRAEFQHPDVVIGFTCLQYFYAGLEQEEFVELLEHLQADFNRETAVEFSQRQAAVLFRTWQQNAHYQPVIELHQLDLTHTALIASLKEKLGRQLEVCSYYLNTLVFPKQLTVYLRKLSSSSFDLAALLFNTTKGFSGTIHNHLCLPPNLELAAQQGADGSMLYILSLAVNQTVRLLSYQSDAELLNQLNVSDFRMVIDAGGLIQQLNNRQVAERLLQRAPAHIQGIVLVDDASQQLKTLTRDGHYLSQSECTIPPELLLKYVDHVHTTGTDMPQHRTDKGLLTVSAHMSLRDLFQGAKRLRQLQPNAYAQTLTLLLNQADAKQIRTLLKLAPTEPLTSRHLLCWLFAHTVEKSLQEFQLAVYAHMHWIVRRRAMQKLLGIFTPDESWSETERLQLLSDLQSHGVLDSYQRVRHQPRARDLQTLDYLNATQRQQLSEQLLEGFRYRQKTTANSNIGLCLQAFSEKLAQGLEQLLGLQTAEHTEEVLRSYKNQLSKDYQAILLAKDQEDLDSILSVAQAFLPAFIMTRQLSVMAEREVQQHQAIENQTQNIKEQQQEQQNQRYTLFRPALNTIWQFNELCHRPINALLVKSRALTKLGQGLRLVQLSEVFDLPFAKHLLATENFVRTEATHLNHLLFNKDLHYFLEIREQDQRWLIAIDMKEAGLLRQWLQKPPAGLTKQIKVHLMPQTLSHTCKPPIADDELVQLKYLNFKKESDYPAFLGPTFRQWQAQCEQYKQQTIPVIDIS